MCCNHIILSPPSVFCSLFGDNGQSIFSFKLIFKRYVIGCDGPNGLQKNYAHSDFECSFRVQTPFLNQF